eukprot:2357038-Alexandrium_andersonii.AAC.1
MCTMWRAPSCNRSKGAGAASSPTSRRLLAACWSAPAPRVGGRVWLGAQLRPRAKSESDTSARVCRS